MHKGLQPAMNDSIIAKETENLIKDFNATAGKEIDPQDIVRTAFGNLIAFIVSTMTEMWTSAYHQYVDHFINTHV